MRKNSKVMQKESNDFSNEMHKLKDINIEEAESKV